MIFLFVFLYLLVATTQLVALTYFDARYHTFRNDSFFMVFISLGWFISLPIIVMILTVNCVCLGVDKLRGYFQENM